MKHLIFGSRAIIEAIEEGKDIEKIVLSSQSQSELNQQLRNLATKKGIQIQFLPNAAFQKYKGKNHQGALAYVSQIEYQDFESFIADGFEDDDTLLILDRITDVRNLGALARTAECMGVKAIIVPQKGSAAINGDAIKTSAGALNRLPVIRVDYLDLAVMQLQEAGVTVISCTEKAHPTLKSLDIHGPNAVIMGSEENGITPKLIKMSDKKVKIDTPGKTASLNVSVACGMILYELKR